MKYILVRVYSNGPDKYFKPLLETDDLEHTAQMKSNLEKLYPKAFFDVFNAVEEAT